MSNKQEQLPTSKMNILNDNRNINKETVIAYDRLEKELKKLGVEIKPEFGLEPALGGNMSKYRHGNF